MFKSFCLALIVGFSMLTLSFAQEPNIIKELDLSPKQVREIRQQRQANMRVETELKNQLQEQQRVLNTELSKSEPDQKKVKELVHGINKLRGSMYEHKVSVRMETQKILDQEQRKKLQELEESNQLGNNQQNRKMSGSGSSGSTGSGDKGNHR